MKRTTLRIDDDLHRELTLAAKEDRRSLNEEVVFAIQELLRKRRKQRRREIEGRLQGATSGPEQSL